MDFDGVINNFEHFDGVDFQNVQWLLEIIEKTDAKIVASTSNKYSFQRDKNVRFENTIYFKYLTLLEEMGVSIFDVTPYVYGDKKLEIIEYLNRHPEISQFLILDDEFIDEELMGHQVLLDLYNGICLEHVNPSVNILNGILGFYPNDFNYKETPDARIVRINQYHSNKK